jgi:hypothetical protein
MAPKFTSCKIAVAANLQDVEIDDVMCAEGADAPEDDSEVEYGYVQIDQYSSLRKNRGEPIERRWVPLEKGTFVRHYAGSEAANAEPACPRTVRPLPSCLKQLRALACKEDSCLDSCDTMSVTSTAASSNECRRVTFRDGIFPGGWDEDAILDETSSTDEMTAPLAEWTFIDRDICGFSLHEYYPLDNEEFAASPFAYDFLEELAEIESQNAYEQHMFAMCAESSQSHRREERQLDKSLLLAGVHVRCLHEDAVEVAEENQLAVTEEHSATWDQVAVEAEFAAAEDEESCYEVSI